MLQNIYWYIGLAIIGAGTVAFTIYKNKHNYKVSTLLAFYLYMAGFTWICEFIVLGVFNSYSYKTGIFTDPWAQNLLGHLLLNTTLYPAVAIVTVTRSHRYLTIGLSVIFFILIEYLFITLGLYEQHWWKYYMTAITVLVLLLIASKWFDKIKHGCSGLTRTITFYFVALIIIHLPSPILLFAGVQYYRMSLANNFFGNLYLSSLIVNFSYHLIESFVLVLFTCIFKKWYFKIFPFVFSIISQSILVKINVLVIRDSWNLIYTLIIYETFIAAFILIEKYTLKPVINQQF